MDRKRFTDASVRALKPGPNDYVVWDQVAPGLGVRVRASGHRSYTFRGRLDGKDIGRLNIGEVGGITLADARGIAQTWGALLKIGKHPRVEREREMAEARSRAQAQALEMNNTVGRLAEDFIAGPLRKTRRADVVAREIRTEFRRWWDRPVTSISRGDAENLVGAVAARGRTGAYALNIMQHGKRIFGWATNSESRRIKYGIQLSVFDPIKARHLDLKKLIRDRVLDNDELRAVWKGSLRLPYPYGPLVRLIMLTGCRFSEVGHARWREFDLRERTWTIPPERFKMGRVHVVPLTDDMIELLEQLPRWNSGDYLFSMDGGRGAFKGVSKHKAGLERHALWIWRSLGRTKGMDRRQLELAPWNHHDLRRTMRTRLSALKVDTVVAELAIGHTRKGMEAVYDQHQFRDEIRAALEAWNGLLRSIVNPKNADKSAKIAA